MLNGIDDNIEVLRWEQNMVEKETRDPEAGADESTEAPIPFPTPERVEKEGEERDLQDETEEETFPASDPQSSWAGPADPRDR
ncbi:hypothetical protein NBCG_04128 [Nocardioidaceae bacterium Broad-1]|nr:hypothetical protein NBCG_04128 [Nocardioidaceae bacterium Broad-1]